MLGFFLIMSVLMRSFLSFVFLFISSVGHAQTQPAITVIASEPAFVAQFPLHTRAGFDQTPVGTVGPIIAIPMQITGVNTASAPQVVNSVLNLSHAFFFSDQGSAPNWVLANDALEFFFVRNVFGFGIESLSFDLQCLACDNAGVPSKIVVEALDNAGATIVRLDQFVELNSTPKFFGVRFVGVNSNRIRVTRDTAPLSFSNWMLDDVRFSYATGQFADGFESSTR